MWVRMRLGNGLRDLASGFIRRFLTFWDGGRFGDGLYNSEYLRRCIEYIWTWKWSVEFEYSDIKACSCI